MGIEKHRKKYTYRAEVRAKINERRELRMIDAALRQPGSCLDRMPPETAQDYIAHYEQYGIEHFTPSHCPAKFRAAVVAHFWRAA